MSCRVIRKERVAIGGDSTTAYGHVEAILYGDEKIPTISKEPVRESNAIWN